LCNTWGGYVEALKSA